MKRILWPMTAILSLLVADAPVAQDAGKTAKTITVTGCIRNHGANSSATMDGGYMLTNTVTGNATGRPASSPGSVSQPRRGDVQSAGTGSSGTAVLPSEPTGAEHEIETAHRSPSYMLNGRDSELRNYIDKKAEVTGSLEDHVDEAGDTNSTPTRGSQTPHGRDTGLQWLRVASVKVMSSDCP